MLKNIIFASEKVILTDWCDETIFIDFNDDNLCFIRIWSALSR